MLVKVTLWWCVVAWKRWSILLVIRNYIKCDYSAVCVCVFVWVCVGSWEREAGRACIHHSGWASMGALHELCTLLLYTSMVDLWYLGLLRTLKTEQLMRLIMVWSLGAGTGYCNCYWEITLLAKSDWGLWPLCCFNMSRMSQLIWAQVILTLGMTLSLGPLAPLLSFVHPV